MIDFLAPKASEPDDDAGDDGDGLSLPNAWPHDNRLMLRAVLLKVCSRSMETLPGCRQAAASAIDREERALAKMESGGGGEQREEAAGGGRQRWRVVGGLVEL